MRKAETKIVGLEKLKILREGWQQEQKTVVFTNGCFDILHRGHVEYLQNARLLGDILIVGLNSDDSVRRIKGVGRPILPFEDRALLLAALESVDYVCGFEEDTPQHLIENLIPDILIKGADYLPEEIVGREVVEKRGGKVITLPLVPQRSSSNIIKKIIELTQQGLLK